MSDVVIVEAVRTPIGVLGGALSRVRPDDLAALVLVELVRRTGISPEIVEEVYLGCANQAGEDNRNVARMATLLAGFPVSVPAVTFNRLCASGLSAVNAAYRAIKAGDGEVYIAGGVESMSRAPYSLPKADQAFPFGNLTAYDTALGVEVSKPAHGRALRHRSDGRNCRKYRGANRHYPRRTGCICAGKPYTCDRSHRRLDDLPRKLCLWWCPKRKRNRSSLPRTKDHGAIRRWNPWQNSNRHFAPTAASLPATLRG